jgi:hypothetical protein
MPIEVERVTRPDGSVLLTLSGAIDDTADLEQVFKGLPKSVIIDLRSVERINSVGVMRWVAALSHLDSITTVTIEAVPYPMVIQANAIRDLFGHADIRSCMAPYFCSECQTCQTPIVTRAEVVAARPDIPQKVCVSCQAVMAFDDIDTYFKFFVHE